VPDRCSRDSDCFRQITDAHATFLPQHSYTRAKIRNFVFINHNGAA
jgi:hypothetical protein